jgi:hypothetical protein
MGTIVAGGRPMRRVMLVGLVMLALLAAAGPAAGTMYVGLEGLTCGSVTVDGTGLPKGTRLQVALVDPASGQTLARGTPTTSAAGAFRWPVQVSLSGRRAVRAVIIQPGASRPVAWAQQSLPQACPLAMTGPPRALPLVGVGASAFALGVLLLAAFAYRGRHLAAPYQGRHAAPF